jgi:hypothetical protein
MAASLIPSHPQPAQDSTSLMNSSNFIEACRGKPVHFLGNTAIGLMECRLPYEEGGKQDVKI